MSTKGGIMESQILDRCAAMMSGSDKELIELGAQIFVANEPNLMDLFVLDMRVRPLETSKRETFWDRSEEVRLNSFKDRKLREIKEAIWGRDLADLNREWKFK